MNDLGVIVDSKLAFSSHVNTIIYLFFSKFCFIVINPKWLQIGVCCLESWICKLCRVSSKAFLKLFMFFTDDFYPVLGISHDILRNRFNVHSLETFIKCLEIVFIFKILNYLTDFCYRLLIYMETS